MTRTYECVEGFEELQEEWHQALANGILDGGQDRTDLMIPLSRLCDDPVAEPEVHTMARVAMAVAKEAGVSIRSMRSRRKVAPIVRPRMLAMHVMTKLCPARTYGQIGWYFGGRDCTTVTNARKKIGEYLVEDAELRNLRDRVLARLGVE